MCHPLEDQPAIHGRSITTDGWHRHLFSLQLNLLWIWVCFPVRNASTQTTIYGLSPRALHSQGISQSMASDRNIHLQQVMHDDELMLLEFADLTRFLIALKQLPSWKERMSFLSLSDGTGLGATPGRLGDTPWDKTDAWKEPPRQGTDSTTARIHTGLGIGGWKQEGPSTPVNSHSQSYN